MSYVIVNVDGCCLSNGRAEAQGGYGIWFGNNDYRNEYGDLPFSHHTNQRAELYAIQRALKITHHYNATVLIRTDSEYAINQANGTQRTNTNLDLVNQIKKLIRERWWPVEFEHVLGHSGNYGNKKADELANMGARSSMSGDNNDESYYGDDFDYYYYGDDSDYYYYGDDSDYYCY